MTNPYIALELAEVADEVRQLLREHIGEDASEFYDCDYASAFVRIRHIDCGEWEWCIEIGNDLYGTTGVAANTVEDLRASLVGLLKSGWIRRTFLESKQS